MFLSGITSLFIWMTILPCVCSVSSDQMIKNMQTAIFKPFVVFVKPPEALRKIKQTTKFMSGKDDKWSARPYMLVNKKSKYLFHFRLKAEFDILCWYRCVWSVSPPITVEQTVLWWNGVMMVLHLTEITETLGGIRVYIVHARWSHASHTFIQAHWGRRWNQLVFGAAGGRGWGWMMVFAAPLELAHVSQSPQAAFRPVWRSTAQHRPVEIQGQKRGIRENDARQTETETHPFHCWWIINIVNTIYK